MKTWSLERIGTNRLLFIGACVATLTFAACSGGSGGGSGSGPSDDDDDPETFTRSGQATNSYLVGATVCVDANFSGSCGTNTVQTKFDPNNNARFALETTKPAGSILVEAREGDTEQYEPGAEEGEGTPVDEDFELVAPAGASKVTPLTTLVHADYVDRINDLEEVNEENRVAAREAARESVEDDLEDLNLGGFNLLNDDYLAAGNGDVRLTASAVGQILRTAVTDTRTAISVDEDPSNFSRAAIAQYAAEQVRANLRSIANAISLGNSVEMAVNNNPTNIQASDNVADAVQTVQNRLEEVANRLDQIDDGEDDEEVTGVTGGSG